MQPTLCLGVLMMIKMIMHGSADIASYLVVSKLVLFVLCALLAFIHPVCSLIFLPSTLLNSSLRLRRNGALP